MTGHDALAASQTRQQAHLYSVDSAGSCCDSCSNKLDLRLLSAITFPLLACAMGTRSKQSVRSREIHTHIIFLNRIPEATFYYRALCAKLSTWLSASPSFKVSAVKWSGSPPSSRYLHTGSVPGTWESGQQASRIKLKLEMAKFMETSHHISTHWSCGNNCSPPPLPHLSMLTGTVRP